MSIKKFFLPCLLILLCWLWLSREGELVTTDSFIVATDSQIQTTVALIPAPPAKLDDVTVAQAEFASNECPFPITHDFEGGRFKLDFTSAFETHEMYAELMLATKKLLQQYDRLVEGEPIQGLQLNILVLPSAEFESFLVGKVAAPQTYLGVYFPAENLAVVKYLNFEQALKTAIHEVAHAINFAVFGELPRFINEGLAEVAEQNVTVSSDVTGFQLPTGIDKQQARASLLDFYALMHSEHDWHTSNNSSLYLSGSAWANFLLTSEQGVEAVKQLLQQKRQTPCEALNSDQIIDVLTDKYPNFEQDFYYWFDEL